MARQAPFTEYEAVLLLDAYLRTVSGDTSRRDAVKNCSDDLRRMAINKGIEIEDAYRNTGGISFQMASMESAYRGMTITKPATKLFAETVSMCFLHNVITKSCRANWRMLHLQNGESCSGYGYKYSGS
ncbi:MAG: hypothetical protein IJI87_08500 [Mogibacterium sp.]|nr:hypothetical protein [Mogibacterium sp.]